MSSTFVVCSATAAAGFAFFAHRKWSTENTVQAIVIFLALLQIELYLLPRSLNPFWYLHDATTVTNDIDTNSSDIFSSIVVLTVFGLWTAILAIGIGAIVSWDQALKSERRMFELVKSDHEKKQLATENKVKEDEFRVSRDMRFAVASNAAATGKWKQLDTAVERHNTSLLLPENERVWSKTLYQELDKKAIINVADNAIDKRWREMEDCELHLKEMKRRNMEKEKRIKDQRARRAEQAVTERSELATERAKVTKLTEELEFLKVGMEEFKKESMKKERQKVDDRIEKMMSLNEREMNLKKQEEKFEQYHKHKLEVLTERDSTLKKQEEQSNLQLIQNETTKQEQNKYKNDTLEKEKQNLQCISQELESAKIEVAAIKEKMEIRQREKIEELNGREIALKEREEGIRLAVTRKTDSRDSSQCKEEEEESFACSNEINEEEGPDNEHDVYSYFTTLYPETVTNNISMITEGMTGESEQEENPEDKMVDEIIQIGEKRETDNGIDAHSSSTALYPETVTDELSTILEDMTDESEQEENADQKMIKVIIQIGKDEEPGNGNVAHSSFTMEAVTNNRSTTMNDSSEQEEDDEDEPSAFDKGCTQVESRTMNSQNIPEREEEEQTAKGISEEQDILTPMADTEKIVQSVVEEGQLESSTNTSLEDKDKDEDEEFGEKTEKSLRLSVEQQQLAFSLSTSALGEQGELPPISETLTDEDIEVSQFLEGVMEYQEELKGEEIEFREKSNESPGLVAEQQLLERCTSTSVLGEQGELPPISETLTDEGEDVPQFLDEGREYQKELSTDTSLWELTSSFEMVGEESMLSIDKNNDCKINLQVKDLEPVGQLTIRTPRQEEKGVYFSEETQEVERSKATNNEYEIYKLLGKDDNNNNDNEVGEDRPSNSTNEIDIEKLYMEDNDDENEIDGFIPIPGSKNCASMEEQIEEQRRKIATSFKNFQCCEEGKKVVVKPEASENIEAPIVEELLLSAAEAVVVEKDFATEDNEPFDCVIKDLHHDINEGIQTYQFQQEMVKEKPQQVDDCPQERKTKVVEPTRTSINVCITNSSSSVDEPFKGMVPNSTISSTYMPLEDERPNSLVSSTPFLDLHEEEDEKHDECIDREPKIRAVEATREESTMDCSANSSSIDESFKDAPPSSTLSTTDESLKDPVLNAPAFDKPRIDHYDQSKEEQHEVEIEEEEEDEEDDKYIDQENGSIFSNNSNNNLAVKKPWKNNNNETNNNSCSNSTSDSNSNNKSNIDSNNINNMSLVLSKESAVEVVAWNEPGLI